MCFRTDLKLEVEEGVRTFKMVKQCAESTARNSGRVAIVRELVTGDRRVTPGRGFVKIGKDDLRLVFSNSFTYKLTGVVRPATLFTWPRTNRFSPFREIKPAPKGFQDIKGIENLIAELNAVPLDAFDYYLVGILEGHNKSVAVEQGSFYFLCVCVCLRLSVPIDRIPEGNCLTTYCSQIQFFRASFVLLLQVAFRLPLVVQPRTCKSTRKLSTKPMGRCSDSSNILSLSVNAGEWAGSHPDRFAPMKRV